MTDEIVDSQGFYGSLLFYINGKKHIVRNPQPETTLLEYLREQKLTGTKLVCGEGGCGACTVMAQSYDRTTKKIVNRAINACISPLCSMDSTHVITVEGIGSRREGAHPVQERIAKANGSQCGFCTPGIVMSMYTLLRNNPNPTAQDIEENFDGNLCRCTGYRPILDAAKSFACCEGKTGGCCKKEAWTEPEPKKTKICPGTGKPCGCGEWKADLPSFETDYDPAKELIFPPELMRRAPTPLRIHGERCHYYRPLSLEGVLNLKRAHPDLKFIIGSSEIAIEMKFRKLVYPKVVNSALVPELTVIRSVDDKDMVIGGSVTLARLEEFCKEQLEARPKYQNQVTEAVLQQLRWFAGKQIRNAASVGGNICTASPISDLNPVWVACGAIATLINVDGVKRDVPMSEFFLGYRKTALKPDEILLSIRVPYSKKGEYVEAYKQARRRDDDIAIVTACFRVVLEQGSSGAVVRGFSASYGGMAPITVHTKKTVKEMIGRAWDEKTFTLAREWLADDLPLSDDAPGAMIAYRRSLTTSFFYKFSLVSCSRFLEDHPGATGVNAPKAEHMGALERFHRPLTAGVQDFENAPKDQIGHGETHLAAELQATGEAKYVDDMPRNGGYHSAFLLSKKAHARVLSIDASNALTMPGVVGFFTSDDVPGSNKVGAVFADEEVFYSKEVPHVGAPMGILVADTHAQAVAAVEKIQVEYEELSAVLTMEQAIRENSFLSKDPHVISSGDVNATLNDKSKCPKTLEGEVRMGGQEHFYLEPHTTVAEPGENDEMICYSSTQNPTKTQMMVASVLGVPAARVVCRVKRMGGGFGGKETRSCNYASAVAVAAQKLGRPVRVTLDRDVDMSISGQRHSFLAKYKVGYTDEGRLVALDAKLYNNAGCSFDLSQSVMDRALFHCDNNYHIPNMRVEGWLCKMNIASNTAFRGFGGPQGMMVIEQIIDRIARTLQKSPEDIRALNAYTPNQLTHYGQELDHCTGPKVWEKLVKEGDLEGRKQRCKEFNSNNRWKKRGVAAIPVKFGISFTAKFMNQAGALVNIYTDGTVLVTHGGTEMGQGLHTKMAQVAAAELGVPVSQVYIAETATDKVPNTSPTAASMGSDLNGMAVLEACQKLNERLAPLRQRKPKASFNELVNAAYFERISLSATGFHATPNIGYDFEKQEGRPFAYFTYGAGLSEVEVDCLTGDFQVLGSHIVMDLGKCINPTVDIGQVEGAFVQGMGWSTLEELVWTPRGEQFTRGPSTYKIPSFSDIPINFHVSILRDAPNPHAVHSSKAVGEPPLFLGSSVFFAIKDAISAARADEGLTGDFNLDSPATCERIRMACPDDFTKQFTTRKPGEVAKRPALIFGSFEPEGFR